MENDIFPFLTTEKIDRIATVIHAMPIDQRIKDPAKHTAKII
jgi:hypothetical protein